MTLATTTRGMLNAAASACGLGSVHDEATLAMVGAPDKPDVAAELGVVAEPATKDPAAEGELADASRGPPHPAMNATYMSAVAKGVSLMGRGMAGSWRWQR